MSKFIKSLREKTDEELMDMLKKTEYEQIKAGSLWGRNMVDKNKAGLVKTASRGEKTSVQKDLRRNKAKILTILKERQK